MNRHPLVDSINMSIRIGITKIFLPTYDTREFTIFEDLAELLNTDTNHEAEELLKQRVLEKGIKGNIIFDSESDYVSVASKKSRVILDIAIIINELANNRLDDDIPFYKEFLDNWKRPKGQKWGVGDIFSIPLSDGSFYFAQVIELIEGLTPIIVIFDIHLEQVPDREMMKESKPLAVLSIISDKLDDFSFRVVGNMAPLTKIPSTIRRDPIRNIQYSSRMIVEYCQAMADNGDLAMYEDFTSNTMYISKKEL